MQVWTSKHTWSGWHPTVWLGLDLTYKSLQVNYELVAQRTGVTTSAAKKRVSRLRLALKKAGLLEEDTFSENEEVKMEETEE